MFRTQVMACLGGVQIHVKQSQMELGELKKYISLTELLNLGMMARVVDQTEVIWMGAVGL